MTNDMRPSRSVKGWSWHRNRQPIGQPIGDDLDAFLVQRFGRSMVEPLKAIHQIEEERPIETLWDVTVAATAHARSIPNNDKRLEIERAAGELLKLAA